MIGLARTTEGNEHLINADATSLILRCLSENPQDDESFLLYRIDSVKRLMVPDCYLCAAPCGKNKAYDIDQIENETQEIRQLKYKIFDTIQVFAKTGHTVTREEEVLLYQSLILLGIDAPLEDILRTYHTKVLEMFSV